MTTINYGIVLDISNNGEMTDTDASIGLDTGIFYWITGIPTYSKADSPCQYSGEAPTEKTWKESIITAIEKMSPIIRIGPDIVQTGGYGSLSGFSLEKDNTSKFWNTLATNSYYLINRPIDVYIFLDDVSYHIWGGVVAEVRYDEIVYKINCEDDFKLVHKPLPPDKITLTSFPDADVESVGDIIPISIGNVNKSKVMNVRGISEPIVLGNINNENIKTTAATSASINSDGNYVLTIKTPFLRFEDDHFKDTGQYWLRVIKGSTESVKILTNNSASAVRDSDSTVDIVLAQPLSLTATEFNSAYQYAGTLISKNVWFFQIIKMNVDHVVSNKAIEEFVLNSNNEMELTYYNKDRKDYDNINEMIVGKDATAANIYNMPYIDILNNYLNIEGDFKRLVPIFPTKLNLISHTTAGPGTVQTDEFTQANMSTLIDKSRATSLEIKANEAAGSAWIGLYFTFNIYMPDDVIINELDELYLAFEMYGDGGGDDTAADLKWFINGYTAYGLLFDDKTESDYPESFDAAFYLYLLDNQYYLGAGNAGGKDSAFGAEVNSVRLMNLIKVNSDLMDSFNDGLAINRFRLYILYTITPTVDQSITNMKMYQIGFIGMKKLNVIKDDIYIKIKGEKYD